VQVLNDGVFTMNGGEISRNEVKIFSKFVASAGDQATSQPYDPKEGKFAYSLDGVTWITVNLPGTWWGLAYAHDRFIALSAPTKPEDGQIAYSLDGVNWTTKPVKGQWWGAAYGGGRYVAVGAKCVAYSTDGETWNRESSTVNFRRVVYGNGKFVALSRDGAFYLDNKNIWQPFGTLASGNWLGLIYADAKFVAVSFGLTKTIAVDKNDGNGWAKFDYDRKLNLGGWGGIAYGNSKFVVVSRTGKTAYSTDSAATWIDHLSPPSGDWDDVTYGNGRFVAVGSDSKTIYSDDGTNWTQPRSLLGQWRQVSYGNDSNRKP
jgi:hypothetical protein